MVPTPDGGVSPLSKCLDCRDAGQSMIGLISIRHVAPLELHASIDLSDDCDLTEPGRVRQGGEELN